MAQHVRNLLMYLDDRAQRFLSRDRDAKSTAVVLERRGGSVPVDVARSLASPRAVLPGEADSSSRID
jgi:hypothetical protein